MVQLSLRIDEHLHREATTAARASGTSLNAYIARVLRIAIDPTSDEPDADRIRTRLAAAGLIDARDAAAIPARDEEDEARFQAALARSRGGTSGSALISEDRARR